MAFSNVVRFNESVLCKFVETAHQVVSKVVTVHVLKYPIALQETPMTSKFGLNGPMGGFIEPWNAQLLRELLMNEDLLALQEISDTDPSALFLADWVNSREDITEVELGQQMNDHDKSIIQMMGFKKWLEQEKKFNRSTESQGRSEYSNRESYWSTLESWARENNFLNSEHEKDTKERERRE